MASLSHAELCAEPVSTDIFSESVRSLGAAGSYAAFADDASAFLNNPAGLGRHLSERKFFVQNHFSDDFDNWALKANIVDGVTENPLSWGLNFDTVHTDLTKKENYTAAVAFNWNNYILIGSNTNFTNFRNAARTRSDWSVTNTFGLIGMLTDNFAVAASAKNAIIFDDDANFIGRIWTGALSYNLKRFRASLQLERNQKIKKLVFRGGAEFQYSQFGTIRAGYFRDKDNDEAGYSFGKSIRPSQDSSFNLDLAIFEQLKSDYRAFSVGVSFRI